MIKKVLAIVFLFFCISLLGGSLYTWHIEKIDNLVNLEIRKYAKDHLPVNIEPGQVEFQILPMSATIKNIKIIPKKELSDQINELEILKVNIRPSFLHLLIGKLHLAKVEIDGAKIIGRLKIKNESSNTTIHLQKILEQIPITQIKVNNIDLDLHIADGKSTYDLNALGINTTLTNDVNNLLVKMRVESVTAVYDGKLLAKQSFFETHFFLTEKNIVLSDFKFKEQNAFIVASGSTQHSLSKKIIKSGNFNIRSQINLKKGQEVFELFKEKEVKNPFNEIKGEVRTDLRLQFTGTNKYTVKTQTTLSQFSYEKFNLGDIDLDGQFSSDSNTVKAFEVKLSNPGIKAKISDFSMNLKDLNFQNAQVQVEKFILHDFLNYALKIKIPANARVAGTVKCGGQVNNFKIDCSGKLTANDLLVSPGKEPILDLDRADVTGSVTVNDKEVSYDAQIATARSTGSSQGTINYKTGFLINYDTSNLDLSEFKKISVLELDGKARVNGSTQGNSDAATFEFLFDGKGVSLNQYKLGDITNSLRYKSGKIYAEKIQGSLVSSRYLGQLTIDLNEEMLTGKLQFPFVDLAVAKDAIKAHLPLPVEIAGSGSAIINIDGPLDPNRLSFKAKARLYNCKVDQQHIDTAEIDIHSVLGKMNFNSAYLEEKNSNMLFTGLMYLDKKEYDLKFSSQRIHLDDIVYSKNYSAPTKGVFQLDGKIKNSFSSPALDFHFTSENFFLAGQKLAPLVGDVKINQLKTTLEVLGPNGLKFSYRDQKSSPDIHLEGTTQSMNLAPLITSLLAIDNVEDYSIIANSNFNVKVNRTDSSKINGYIFIPELQVALQKVDLVNEKEISLFLTNGKLNFAPFVMRGKGGKIEFTSSTNSIAPVDVQVSGLFSLSFLHILAPFLETLEGQTSVNFKVQNPGGKMRFVGSAFVEDGFIKLPDIQHAIEDLKIDILFNQDQIILNSIKGRFASGQLLGDGRIVLKGSKDIPMALKIHLDNVDMNIPPQVNTLGSADLQLTGNWLPFLLSGTYNVSDGEITKEFSGSESAPLSPHQIFLPQALRSDSVSPIRLDLTINQLAPLKIKNSLVDGKIEGRIKVSGFPKSPILGGNISFTKNTQLNFRDVIFKVRDSSIILSNSNPPNPALYILAEARYKGYDIEMLVQGTAEKPKFKLSSQPSLTEPEIISLLTLGYTSGESAQASNPASPGRSSVVGSQSSLEIGTGLFSQNPLGKEFKNRFGFDVQVSSRFDSATSVAVPKISATKQFTEKMSGVVSVQTGKDSRSEGKLRYDLNRGFGATMSVQTRTQQESNLQQGDAEPNILGIDLEFRKDFK